MLCNQSSKLFNPKKNFVDASLKPAEFSKQKKIIIFCLRSYDVSRPDNAKLATKKNNDDFFFQDMSGFGLAEDLNKNISNRLIETL